MIVEEGVDRRHVVRGMGAAAGRGGDVAGVEDDPLAAAVGYSIACYEITLAESADRVGDPIDSIPGRPIVRCRVVR